MGSPSPPSMHSAAVSRTRMKRSRRPANMKVSPGRSDIDEVFLDLAESGPKPRLPTSRTFRAGASTMVPMFMRSAAAVRALRTCIRPSLSRNSFFHWS